MVSLVLDQLQKVRTHADAGFRQIFEKGVALAEKCNRGSKTSSSSDNAIFSSCYIYLVSRI